MLLHSASESIHSRNVDAPNVLSRTKRSGQLRQHLFRSQTLKELLPKTSSGLLLEGTLPQKEQNFPYDLPCYHSAEHLTIRAKMTLCRRNWRTVFRDSAIL